MAKTISVGYTDTAISGVTSLTLPRGLINYKADFRKQSNTASDLTIVNLTTPVDRPEKLRFSTSDVADVYKGTDIDSSVFAPSRRGVSVLVQLTETISVTDTVDASFRVDLPVSAHLVLKIPASEFISADMVQTIVGRLASGLFETGSTATSRIQSLLRGSLSPADM